VTEPEDARCSVSWSSGDSPELSFDEPFCISERGCDNLLRRLTASDADVDQLDALLETVRFDANKDEWLTLLRLDDVFATGVFDDTGALIGVSTCVRYDEKNVEKTFGWCGNVVVDASLRGRGVARKLLRAALEDVGADGAAWLDASDMGISLYEKAGFEPRSRVVRWTKDVPSGLNEPATPYDLAFDSTFLCAIPPSRRKEWASKYASLIRPGGELVSNVFPNGDFEGGPPFALSPKIVADLLVPVGFEAVSLTDVPETQWARGRQEYLYRFRRT
jgi:GNAT superfamily N-acetyltransferase